MGYEIIDAVCSGDVAKVVELLNRGADVNASDSRDRTPLHFAAFKRYAEIASLLLKHGADVNARDDAGDTPLHYAARSGCPSLVKLLLKYGGDRARQKKDL
jgi:ankyrin repeat protein